MQNTANEPGFDPDDWMTELHRHGWLRCSAERDTQGTLRVRGAYARPASYQDKLQVMLNEAPAQNVTYDLPGDPIFNYRGYEPPTGNPGFEFYVPDNLKPPYRIWIADEHGSRVNPWHQDWIHLEETGLPCPGTSLHKKDNLLLDDWYHFCGGTFAAKLISLIEQYDGREINSFKTIVDWGCSTGRVARHLPRLLPGVKVFGIDIDREAIQWAKNETPHVDFYVSERSPPMPIADRMTDLLISHSVFSHLPEADQCKWLTDLDRVMERGGLLLVTTLSQIAPFILPVPTKEAAELRLNGFTCFDADHLEEKDNKPKEGYSPYRLTYHSYEYIRREWGKYFEIIDILDGYADFLAMVIMRARPRPSL